MSTEGWPGPWVPSPTPAPKSSGWKSATVDVINNLSWETLNRRPQPTEHDYAIAEETAARLARMSDAELAQTWRLDTDQLRAEFRDVFAEPWR